MVLVNAAYLDDMSIVGPSYILKHHQINKNYNILIRM